MIYQFDTDDAKKYGINEAIILYNLKFWIMKNYANKKHSHKILIADNEYERTWTYNSVKAFSILFDFLTTDQIRRAIEKLVLHNVIIKGNFNELGYDRTTWFCCSDESFLGKPICDKPQHHLANLPNRIGRFAEPIPDSKPDSNTNNNLIITTPQKTGLDATAPSIEKTLSISLKNAFLSKNDNKFSNYPKESIALKQLSQKLIKFNPESPEELGKALMSTFWTLKNEGKQFWQGQPFLPSILNSAGIFDRVLESLRNNTVNNSNNDTALQQMREAGII